MSIYVKDSILKGGMNIPAFPDSAPISLEMRSELHPSLVVIPDGISEFTFANLYLFREQYDYHISWLPNHVVLISGKQDGKSFAMLPCGFPEDNGPAEEVLRLHDYVKGLAEPHADAERIRLERFGYMVFEDRDNFDYLYLKKDLEALQGKKYHKKRNLVNAFINNYNYEECPLNQENIDATFEILEEWRREKGEEGDYKAAREALERMEELELTGYLICVDGKPAAYTLGEPLAKGRSFAVHFEKAIGDYKGIYQFMNRAFASVLPRHYHYINREQDLGDQGLRQAKMTYRPCGFAKKYKVVPKEE